MFGRRGDPAAHHRRSAALGPGGAGQVARRRRRRDPDQVELPGGPGAGAVRRARRERLRQGLPALLRRLPGHRPGPAAGGLPGPGAARGAPVRACAPGHRRAQVGPARAQLAGRGHRLRLRHPAGVPVGAAAAGARPGRRPARVRDHPGQHRRRGRRRAARRPPPPRRAQGGDRHPALRRRLLDPGHRRRPGRLRGHPRAEPAPHLHGQAQPGPGPRLPGGRPLTVNGKDLGVADRSGNIWRHTFTPGADRSASLGV